MSPPSCRISAPASCFLPGTHGYLFSAEEGPPPCHLGLLAAQAHSQAFPSTSAVGQLFAWQNLFVFGAVTCQGVTRPREKEAGDGSSWPEPFPRGLGDGGRRSAQLLSGAAAGGCSGVGPALQAEQTGPLGRLPVPAQAALGGSHPVLGKAPPLPARPDPATFPDTTWCPALSGRQENSLQGRSWPPFISIMGVEQGAGAGNGNPLQCSCPENPMDRGAWRVCSLGLQELDTT